MRSRGWALMIAAALWIATVVAADLAFVIFAFQQARTSRYEMTSGQLVAGPPTSHRNRNTIVYGYGLAYTYVVGGATFHGHRYRALQTSSRTEAAAHTLIVGERVSVYYAPENPAEAVLRPGLDGGDVVVGLFLVPFNAIALALARAVQRAARRSRSDDATGGLRVVEAGAATRVLPEIYGPVALAILWASAAAFGLAVLGGFWFAFDPPRKFAAADVLAVLAVAAISYVDAANRTRSGAGEVVIDATTRTIRFPLGQRGPQSAPIPWSTIDAVVVEHTAVAWSGRASVYYWVSVIRSHGERVRVRSMVWTDRAAAERFRRWLEAHVEVGGA